MFNKTKKNYYNVGFNISSSVNTKYILLLW